MPGEMRYHGGIEGILKSIIIEFISTLIWSGGGVKYLIAGVLRSGLNQNSNLSPSRKIVILGFSISCISFLIASK
jgi:hypothetical protein